MIYTAIHWSKTEGREYHILFLQNVGHGYNFFSNVSLRGFPNLSLFFYLFPMTTMADESHGQRTKIHPSLWNLVETAIVARGKPRACHIPLGKLFHFATNSTGRCAGLYDVASGPMRVTQPWPRFRCDLFRRSSFSPGHTFTNKVGVQKSPEREPFHLAFSPIGISIFVVVSGLVSQNSQLRLEKNTVRPMEPIRRKSRFQHEPNSAMRNGLMHDSLDGRRVEWRFASIHRTLVRISNVLRMHTATVGASRPLSPSPFSPLGASNKLLSRLQMAAGLPCTARQQRTWVRKRGGDIQYSRARSEMVYLMARQAHYAKVHVQLPEAMAPRLHHLSLHR